MRPRSRSPFRRRPAALKIVGADTAGEVEILLYDEIGFWGIQAKDFVTELQAIQAETIHLRINSPGGDVFDGLAMFNALREHPAQIITHIDGLAASMASVIALAGNEVRMAENAFFMVHHPWAFTLGNASEHRKRAELLDKLAGSLIGTYVSASGADKAQVTAWMDEETWFTAEEAQEAGFADAIEDGAAVEASFDLSLYQHAPAALVSRPAAATPTKRNLERTLREAGYSRSEAKAIAAASSKALPQRDADEDGLIATVIDLAATIHS